MIAFLQQGYRYHKLRKTFSKLYRRHYELISSFNVGLKTLLREGHSEPKFSGDFFLLFILNCKKPQTIITYIQCLIILSYTNGAKKSSRTQRVGDELHLLLIFAQFANL